MERIANYIGCNLSDETIAVDTPSGIKKLASKLLGKRFVAPLLVIALCLAVAFLVFVLYANDSFFASWVSRAFAVTIVAGIIIALQRKTQLTFADVFGASASRERIRTTACIAAITFALSLLLSLALLFDSSHVLQAFTWVLAVLIDLLLLPLTIQILRDNGLRMTMSKTIYFLIVAPVFYVVLSLWANNMAWSSMFLAPAVACLAIVPAAIWHLVFRAILEEGGVLPFGNQTFLAAQGIMCLAVFALCGATLFNLGSSPFSGLLSMKLQAVAFGLGISAAPLAALHLLESDMLAILSESQVSSIAYSTKLVHSDETYVSSTSSSAGDEQILSSTAQGNSGLTDAERNALGASLLGKQFELTVRQQQIIEFIANGDTRQVIADKLSVSRNTVNTHARIAYLKMDIHTKEELLAMIEEAVEER